MAQVEATMPVPVPAAEVWELYFDQERWPTWVDGFGGVDSSEGYPGLGGTLRWHSNPAGRGTVEEKVIVHEPRQLHRVEFRDQYSEGQLAVRFAIRGNSTSVTQTYTYKLTQGGLLTPVTDVLFIRPQLRRSLVRSLERLRREAEEISGR